MKNLSRFSSKIFFVSLLFLLLSNILVVDNSLYKGVVWGKYFWAIVWLYIAVIVTCVLLFIGKIAFVWKKNDYYIISVLIYLILHAILRNSGSILLYSDLFVLCLLFYILRYCNFVFSGINYFLILLAVVVSIWGVMQYFHLIGSYNINYEVVGPFFNPALFAAFISAVSPLVTFRLVSLMKKKENQDNVKNYFFFQVAYLVIILIFLTALVLSCNRAALLAFFITNVALMLTYTGKISLIIKSKLCVLSIISLTLLFMIALYLLNVDSADGRLFVWSLSLKGIINNPFGIGLGKFSSFLANSQESYFRDNGLDRFADIADYSLYAFNDLLQYTLELGWLFGFMVLSILFYTVYIALKERKYALLACLINLCITSFFSYTLHQLSFLILFVFIVSEILYLHDINVFYKKYNLNIVRLIILLPMMSIIVLAYQKRKEYEGYKLANEAHAAYKFGDYSSAIHLYKLSTMSVKSNYVMKLEYAESLFNEKRYDESFLIFSDVSHYDGNPLIYCFLGKIHQIYDNKELAIFNYQKAMYILPNRFRPYLYLSQLYYEVGDYGKAILVADLGLAIRPKVKSEIVIDILNNLKLVKSKALERI